MTQQTNEQSCLLRHVCRDASVSNVCTPLCESFIRMSGRIQAADVPSDYRLVTLQTSPVRDDQPEVYRTMDAYTATFQRQFENGSKRIKSVYLYSADPGTGKTTTAAALLNEWMIVQFVGAAKRGQQPPHSPAYFLDVNRMQTVYNRMILSIGDEAKKPFADEFNRMLDRAQKTPFVVMDDIGVRDASDAFRAYVHDVINYRVTNALPTVYTSNVRINELKRVFDSRLADRVRDMCVEIEFSGKSKRGMR